jgi:hypothetical protein
MLKRLRESAKILESNKICDITEELSSNSIFVMLVRCSLESVIME